MSAATVRPGRPKRAIARFLHDNRSTHTHNLGERDGDESCRYCDLDAAYALRALADAGFEVVFTDRCTGAGRCQASIHVHGCFADFGKCDVPDEHGPAEVGGAS